MAKTGAMGCEQGRSHDHTNDHPSVDGLTYYSLYFRGAYLRIATSNYSEEEMHEKSFQNERELESERSKHS